LRWTPLAASITSVERSKNKLMSARLLRFATPTATASPAIGGPAAKPAT
jgi:hypothetical protein